MNKKIERFSPEVEEIYTNHDWPGNVRELENAVEYGANMAFGNVIGIDEVPARILKKKRKRSSSGISTGPSPSRSSSLKKR